jgi:hypothetical protein
MRGVSEYRSEHYDSEQARAVAGEAWNQEQQHRDEFGDSNHEPKPVGIAPAMKVAHPGGRRQKAEGGIFTSYFSCGSPPNDLTASAKNAEDSKKKRR